MAGSAAPDGSHGLHPPFLHLSRLSPTFRLRPPRASIQPVFPHGSVPPLPHLLASSAPSMMTWPPVSPSRRYSSEYQEEGLSDTKLVLSSAAPLVGEWIWRRGAGHGGSAERALYKNSLRAADGGLGDGVLGSGPPCGKWLGAVAVGAGLPQHAAKQSHAPVGTS